MTLAVGGENLIDFVQDEAAGLPPAYRAHPGGSPMNVAMAASRQGMDVHYLSPVSSDSMGDLIAARLAADGVALATPRRPEPTSLAVVSLRDGAASYQFYRSNTAERQISPDQLAAATPEGLKAFHIGSLAVTDGADADAWEDYHAKCYGAGVFTSYDPNARPSLTPDKAAFVARVERMVTRCSLLKLSDEDLAWLYPDMTEDDAFRRLCALASAHVVVLTKGPDGARAVSGEVEATVPAAPVEPLVDTVGAGDTFMATLIRILVADEGAGRVDADRLKQILSTASRAAAINCTRVGCQPPTLAELA